MSRYARDPVSGSILPVAGGGSGGHTILDEDGTTYPQRSKLQFEGAIVSDDETNDKTVVETVNPVEYEEDIYGVNLIPYPYSNMTQTISGITFTVNSDGSITLNGTSTKVARLDLLSNDINLEPDQQYVLSGCPSGGNRDTKYILELAGIQNDGSVVAKIDKGNKVNVTGITVAKRVYIRVASGYTANNVVFHPMLRKATIQDDTYRPYNQQSIQNQLTEQTNVLGAKNLIPYPYKETTLTRNGIIWTVNNDGTITANGTATAHSAFQLFNGTGAEAKKIFGNTKILVTGCPANGSNTTYYMRVLRGTGTPIVCTDRGSGAGFNTNVFEDSETIKVIVNVDNGNTVTNLTFKPMLRLASDPDSAYVPYAMTNRELTERMLRLSVFNSNYSIPIADCDSFIGVFGVTNASTLNTPYKAGLTGGYAAGMIIQIVPNTTGLWNTQIYIASGCGNTSSPSTTNVIFIRAKSNSSAWSPWTKLI